MVTVLIGLRTKTLHRRTLSFVKHTQLQTGFVGNNTHLTTQSVNFPNQMTFARSAYRRIAGKKSNIVKTHACKQSLMTFSGAGKRRFAAGMPRPYHNYFVFFHIIVRILPYVCEHLFVFGSRN
jgi:hypothetical protein